MEGRGTGGCAAGGAAAAVLAHPVRLEEACHDPQGGRLAGAGPADDPHRLAAPDLYVAAAQDVVGAKGLPDVAQLDQHVRVVLARRHLRCRARLRAPLRQLRALATGTAGSRGAPSCHPSERERRVWPAPPLPRHASRAAAGLHTWPSATRAAQTTAGRGSSKRQGGLRRAPCLPQAPRHGTAHRPLQLGCAGAWQRGRGCLPLALATGALIPLTMRCTRAGSTLTPSLRLTAQLTAYAMLPWGWL
jgi:hypothetical protein